MHAKILSQLQSSISDMEALVAQLRSQQSVSTQGVEGGPDTDGDGLTDQEEEALGTDPEDPDEDGDELSDGDEVHIYGTDPLNDDSDDDGLLDGEEIELGTDPKKLDTDGDGLSDEEEHEYDAKNLKYRALTNPLDPDSDEDGLNDGQEDDLEPTRTTQIRTAMGVPTTRGQRRRHRSG